MINFNLPKYHNIHKINPQKTLIIGDIHGCYYTLKKLISYFPKYNIIACGDLIGRGKNSLKVLELFYNNQSSFLTILGNHEIYMLYKYFYKFNQLKEIFPEKYIQYLLKAKLYYYDNNDLFISHAGIPPCWDFKESIDLANSFHNLILKDYKMALSYIADETKLVWDQKYQNDYQNNKLDKTHFSLIVNYYTRMRLCNKIGKLILNKSDNTNKEFQPWFTWNYKPSWHNKTIVFGHWSKLGGVFNQKNILGLDTSCVYNGSLSAINLLDKKVYQVKNED